MQNRITVRFVPHAGGALSMSSFAGPDAMAASSQLRPAKKSMQNGLKAFAERNVLTQPTPLDRLTADLKDKEFTDLFGPVDLETHKTSGDKTPSVTMASSYSAPKKALPIPDALKAHIAFAYIPQPVEFYASHFLPPFEENYHLQLSAVASILNAHRCHRNGWTGKGVKVAMADTGFWLHPHFVRAGFKLLPTESPGSGDPSIDTSGHGTGEAANIFAIAPDCTVYGVKHGSSAASTLETCIDQSPDVMTNSWGWNVDTQSREKLRTDDPNFFLELVDLENVLSLAYDRGITVLFAAGNGQLSFPACFPKVIAVGGVTANEDGSLEASSYASGFKSKIYSNRDVPDFCGVVGKSGKPPLEAHIMLPVPADSELDGENFASARKKLGWGIFSGTSAASPQIAGVVALMKAISPNLKPEQIRQILSARAIDVTKGRSATGATAGAGKDLATGAGLVDSLRACSQLITS